MDSLGGPRGDKNGHQLKRFLQDLDTYTPRPRDQQLAREGRGHGYKVDTDEDLLRILEESRVEHETDKQMREGTHVCAYSELPLIRPPWGLVRMS